MTDLYIRGVFLCSINCDFVLLVFFFNLFTILFDRNALRVQGSVAFSMGYLLRLLWHVWSVACFYKTFYLLIINNKQ